jgi:nucleoside-diphosphate-sugar epimerase
VPVVVPGGREGAENAEPVRILFPGNVYGLGAQTGAPLDESASMSPSSDKGELRVRLEAMLREAARRGDARVLVLRAGDYYGPTVRNGGVDRLFPAASQGRPLRMLGDVDAPHQWAYVPDLARAAVDLLEIDERQSGRLSPFEVVHFPGHVARPQRAFLETIAREAGHPEVPVQAVPWWIVRVLGIFDRQARGLLELRYLWDQSVVLTSRRLPELLPSFRVTPVEEAVRATLESYRVEAAA